MNLPATSTRPRFAAWLLVLVYALSLPGVAPAAMASVAAISGHHEVEVVFANGHLDIVLHHDDDHHEHEHDHDHEHEHEHDALTTLITGVAAHDHDDDHVLHFATSSDELSVSSTALNAPLAPAAWVSWQAVFFQPEWPAREAMQRHAARPPPLASMGMLCLRTTVLCV